MSMRVERASLEQVPHFNLLSYGTKCLIFYEVLHTNHSKLQENGKNEMSIDSNNQEVRLKSISTSVVKLIFSAVGI